MAVCGFDTKIIGIPNNPDIYNSSAIWYSRDKCNDFAICLLKDKFDNLY